MQKITWCCKQSKGIKLVNKNENIGLAYLRDVDIDFKDLTNISGKWKSVVSYYCCYNSLCAILQKLGIKSEIHDCSIELMSLINDFNKKDIELINELKKNRIGVQYYLEDPKDIDLRKILNFILKAKHIFKTISDDEISIIRKQITYSINS